VSEVISQTALCRLVDAWIAQGKQVAGPRRINEGLVLYTLLTGSEQLRLEGFIRPGNSIKEFVLPRHEKLYGYRLEGKEIELYDPEPPAAEQIIIGARPCDSAALPIMDCVFNWDYKDGFYNRRRQLSTVVTLACREHDDHCFCTCVGSGPADERGSDAMLFDLGDGTYEVRCLTDKGKALFAGRTQHSDKVGQVGPGPEKRLDLDAVKSFLDSDFDNPAWSLLTMRCLGCGACAHTCPTCHCFDIVDEGNAAGGARVRNWDACQFAMFTAHASGHNPRTRQGQRQRQRIFHKFGIFPEKFGEIACTGCGNCTRNCPVGLGVWPVLESIAEVVPAKAIETT